MPEKIAEAATKPGIGESVWISLFAGLVIVDGIGGLAALPTNERIREAIAHLQFEPGCPTTNHKRLF